MVIQEVEDLLGLEEPEQIESEHKEINAQIKQWNVNMGEANFPDAEVRQSEPSPEIEGDDVDFDATPEEEED